MTDGEMPSRPRHRRTGVDALDAPVDVPSGGLALTPSPQASPPLNARELASLPAPPATAMPTPLQHAPAESAPLRRRRKGMELADDDVRLFADPAGPSAERLAAPR